MKPPYAIGSVPSLSCHANAYRWRSLPRVRRHRASKPQGSSERVLLWQITMDQLIFASLSHTHYWYEVGMLKVPAEVSEEDELGIALHVEDENTLEQALQMDIETSVEMPTRKMQDLPLPPKTQEEVLRSPFRKAFEHSQKVEPNRLLGVVGCFEVVDEKDAKRSERCRISMGAHV